MDNERRILTPAEVAALFRVDVTTVTCWVKTGKLGRQAWFKTPGGHRRFYEDEIRVFLRSEKAP